MFKSTPLFDLSYSSTILAIRIVKKLFVWKLSKLYVLCFGIKWSYFD